MNQVLSKIISDLETYCKKNTLNHRFVGSVSYGGLLNKKTTFKINIKKKEVMLEHHNKLSFLRADNSIRDIDIILFCDDRQKIDRFKKFIGELRSRGRTE